MKRKRSGPTEPLRPPPEARPERHRTRRHHRGQITMVYRIHSGTRTCCRLPHDLFPCRKARSAPDLAVHSILILINAADDRGAKI